MHSSIHIYLYMYVAIQQYEYKNEQTKISFFKYILKRFLGVYENISKWVTK